MTQACCILKRPFEHEGPWTCPSCGETSVPATPEEFGAGLRAVKAMFEPSEAEQAEDIRVIERALSAFVSDYETSTPDPDIDRARSLLERLR